MCGVFRCSRFSKVKPDEKRNTPLNLRLFRYGGALGVSKKQKRPEVLKSIDGKKGGQREKGDGSGGVRTDLPLKRLDLVHRRYHDADASLGDRVPCVLYGHSQLKGDELDQVEVMSF